MAEPLPAQILVPFSPLSLGFENHTLFSPKNLHPDLFPNHFLFFQTWLKTREKPFPPISGSSIINYSFFSGISEFLPWISEI